jgi:putative ABC transport system substrate-binding protein
MPVSDISRATDQSLIADELASRFIPPSHGQKSQGPTPADLPVQQVVKIELVNRATAKALGLAIPAKLLTLADELIE